MITVLDTSAAVETVLNRSKAYEIMEILKKADWVISVDLFISEVSNVFWKYHCFQNLPLEICKQGMKRAIEIVDNFEPAGNLYQEAFSLACQVNHPVYDVLYLTCTRRKDAVLITLDKKLQKIARKLSIQCEKI